MYRLPWSGSEVPHLVIEVNSVCNIECIGCYKNKTGGSKTYSKIISEIDLACSIRNLQMITLAGGEPTLHSSLPEIINYIAKKHIYVGLVTNGMGLNKGQLEAYRKAGLTKVFIHMDSRQKRPDLPTDCSESDLDELRTSKLTLIVESGLDAGISITLDRNVLRQMRDIVDLFLSLPFSCDLLATCYTNFPQVAETYRSTGSHRVTEPPHPESQDGQVALEQVKTLLHENCNMNATASIPSSHKLSNEKWLLYFSLTSSGDGGGKEALHLQPPFLDRLLAISNRLYYAVGRKHVFHFRFSSLQLAFLGIAYALSTFRRKTIAEVIGFLRRSFKHGSKISLKCVAVHEGPRVSADGVLEVCNNCPDATIRDGKLIPICLADHLPLSDLIGFTSQHKRSN